MTTTTAPAQIARTEAQIARTEARDDAGRFYRNPCECCKKGAPVSDYYSDERCNSNGGFGVVLCKRCAVKLEKLSDAEYSALAARLAPAPVVTVQEASRSTCPFCACMGPHDDNGASGFHLTMMCLECREQWSPNA